MKTIGTVIVVILLVWFGFGIAYHTGAIPSPPPLWPADWRANSSDSTPDDYDRLMDGADRRQICQDGFRWIPETRRCVLVAGEENILSGEIEGVRCKVGTEGWLEIDPPDEWRDLPNITVRAHWVCQ